MTHNEASMDGAFGASFRTGRRPFEGEQSPYRTALLLARMRQGSNLRFIRVGLPFFAIVFGSAFGLHYFQQVRYDFSQVKKESAQIDKIHDDLAKAGVKTRKGLTVEDVYQEVAELDTDNWDNIRGPRSDHPDFSPPEPNASPVPPNPQDPSTAPAPRDPQNEDVVPDPTQPLQIDGERVPNEPSAPEEPSSSQSATSHPSDPNEPQIDPHILAAVLEFGYDEYISYLAIRRTNGVSAEAAINWILDHSNESDFEDNSEDSEEEDVEMGAAQSSEAVASNAASLIRALRPARTHKMVFVANMSLKMGTGKLAAQVGHACLGVYRTAIRSEEGNEAIRAWEGHGAVKIVVKGQSTEQLIDMFRQAKDLGLYAYVVQDAGYTQIPPGSRTILGIFGPQEVVDQVTGTLKLL
uniref:peptidyl-tRNA hydrolase n=1 Tax=Panagrellus redivivus TaxID=6233 RepID=A0A7E4ZRK9_PANRE